MLCSIVPHSEGCIYSMVGRLKLTLYPLIPRRGERVIVDQASGSGAVTNLYSYSIFR